MVSLTLDEGSSNWLGDGDWPGITLNNGIRSIDQPILIPQGTYTVLPLHSATVAELSTASTSCPFVSPKSECSGKEDASPTYVVAANGQVNHPAA
jgi:hypothetical protein